MNRFQYLWALVLYMRWTPQQEGSISRWSCKLALLLGHSIKVRPFSLPSWRTFIEKRVIAMGATMILSKQRKNYIVKPRRDYQKTLVKLENVKEKCHVLWSRANTIFLNNDSWSSMFNTWSRFVVLLETLIWLARSI